MGEEIRQLTEALSEARTVAETLRAESKNQDKFRERAAILMRKYLDLRQDVKGVPAEKQMLKETPKTESKSRVFAEDREKDLESEMEDWLINRNSERYSNDLTIRRLTECLDKERIDKLRSCIAKELTDKETKSMMEIKDKCVRLELEIKAKETIIGKLEHRIVDYDKLSAELVKEKHDKEIIGEDLQISQFRLEREKLQYEEMAKLLKEEKEAKAIIEAKKNQLEIDWLKMTERLEELEKELQNYKKRGIIQFRSQNSNSNTVRPFRIDPSEMKLSKPRIDENIQLGLGMSLGKGGFAGGWSKHSSRDSSGFRPSSQEADRPPSGPANSGRTSDSGSYADRGNHGWGGRRGIPPRRSEGSRQGAPVSRNMAQAFQKHDHEAALKAAKSIVGPDGCRITPSNSKNQSRKSSGTLEHSQNREPHLKRAAPVIKELSEKEIESKAKAILDEYLHIHDTKEAIECVKELESPNTIHCFVSYVLNHVIERSDHARKQAGNLLHELIKQKILTVPHYIKGLKRLLEFAEDIAIDDPKIWECTGILMGYMSYDGIVPLVAYRDALSDLVKCNKAGSVMAYMLHQIAHNMEHIKVGDLWKSSGLSWTEFLPSSENVSDFVKEKKLEFTLGEEVRSPDSLKLPMEEIVINLDRLIIETNVDNEDFYDWVTSNVPESRVQEPQFIRALMTAVCKSAITGSDSESYKMDETQINKRTLLLEKYLNYNAELELQALYALQALVHKLHHPPGLLKHFFDTLYHKDVISEDAFNQWESSTDPSEQVGKGPAQMAVVQFFTWLKEADNEES